MKDGTGAGEPAEVSRQELYGAYANFYRQLCTEVGPCRDAQLLNKAAQYLLREPEPKGSFAVFPFYQAVSEGPGALGTDCRKHLCAFIKATELLETLCVNLFLQPWKKEIRTLKTFTGPFVYCLLPVLSGSTIKSVLASIGYLPHEDTPSEFWLSEDANPDKAMQVGFELLLARVKCQHFLELLEKDQLGRQELLEVLQRSAGLNQPEEPTEKKTATTESRGEEERAKKDEANRKEVSTVQKARPYLDPGPAAHPQPKPRRVHRPSVDQSIMEMQTKYPDLAFRGRPLVPDKPRQAHGGRNSSKDVPSGGEDDGDGQGAELHQRHNVQGARATAALTCGSENSNANEAFVENAKSFYDRTSGGTPLPGNTNSGSSDRSEVNELSGPQAMSLHITLRDGTRAEKTPKPEEPRPPADAQNRNPDKLELLSLSSVDEEQDLLELAKRMRHDTSTKEDPHRREAPSKADENANKEKMRNLSKTSKEESPAEPNLRKPVMETGPPLSRDAGSCSRPFKRDSAASREPNGCRPPHAAFAVVDGGSCGGGGSTGQREEDDAGAEAGRGEEQLQQGFVFV